jgi:tetratricopeptide (TPR) repeat protein
MIGMIFARTRVIRLAGILLGLSGALGAQELGRTDFATSGSPAAQERFLRGVLLLHSFEYADAADEFRAAQKLEPGFSMAYWGEAMTYNHPLWMDRDRAAAVAALDRLAPTPEARRAKAPTERERMYLDAVETLYAEGDRAERDKAYADAMRRLYVRFPDDLDAASFYALALLGTCEGRRDVAVYMQAAAVAEEVFAKNPKHPGAAHYLIHCYDDPVHAPLGMRAARVYAGIAPAAVHALHMPSHIFFAQGMWEEAVSSNVDSWEASVDRARRKGLGPADHSFHALSWLEYAYLQLGRRKDARRTLELMETDAKSGSSHVLESLDAMRAVWIVETGDCSARVLPRPEASGPGDRYVRGACALEAGDRAAAVVELGRLKDGTNSTNASHSHGGMSYDEARDGEIAAVLALELEALIAVRDGDGPRAARLAAEAAAAEDTMTFEFGPPPVVKPAHELAGEILLAQGRSVDAQREFEAALARAPGRSLSLQGLLRAAEASGDAAAARDARAKLAKNWARADPGTPGLPEARGASPAS